MSSASRCCPSPKSALSRLSLPRLRACLLAFLAFVYFYVGKQQTEWRLSPFAYFDAVPVDIVRFVGRDGECLAHGDGRILQLGLPNSAPKPSLAVRVLPRANWRQLAELPGNERAVAMETGVLGDKLYVAAVTENLRLHLFERAAVATDANLTLTLSIRLLGNESLTTSRYAARDTALKIVESRYCRSEVEDCHLLVVAYRLVADADKLTNVTTVDLLPPACVAIGIGSGRLLWRHSAEEEELAKRMRHDARSSLSRHWKLEWASHFARQLHVGERDLDEMLPVYKAVLPFTSAADSPSDIRVACLHCDDAAPRRHGNVLALRQRDSVTLLDLRSGRLLHSLALGPGEGTFAVVEGPEGSASVARFFQDACDGAASLDGGDSGSREYQTVCDSVPSSTVKTAQPLVMSRVGSGWSFATFLRHFLQGVDRVGGSSGDLDVLFLTWDGTVSSHWSLGATNWRAAVGSGWTDDATRPTLTSASDGLVLAVGFERAALVEAGTGRVVASHSLPCPPASGPVHLHDGGFLLRCPRLLLGFAYGRVPIDAWKLGVVMATAMAVFLALAVACC